MKLWIDDLRPAPEGYIWVKSVHEAKIYCCQALRWDRVCLIEEFHMDHDAGDYAYAGGDYIELLKWLERKHYEKSWSIVGTFKFHTGNPVGRHNMIEICKANHWRYIV